MYVDLSIGSLNWSASEKCSVKVSEPVCSSVMWATSAPADSNGPKVTNDAHGYVVGDWAPRIIVICSNITSWVGDMAVCTGGDEPAATTEGPF